MEGCPIQSCDETGLCVYIAKTVSERAALFKQRYDAYLDEGAIDASHAGIFSDHYDDLSTSVLIGIVDGTGEVVGSLRFSVQPPLSHTQQIPLSCPELKIFPDEMAPLVEDDRAIASGSRFSIKPQYTDRRSVALLLLMAEAKAAKAVGAKWGIATARGSHLRLYKRFLMEPICPPRRMPNLKYDYALLASNLDKKLDVSLDRFPSKLLSAFEAAQPNWHTDIQKEVSNVVASDIWLPS